MLNFLPFSLNYYLLNFRKLKILKKKQHECLFNVLNISIFMVRKNITTLLPHKDKTILSEIKDFFTTSEKAIFSILDLLNHLRLSEKQLKIISAPNNQLSNLSKLYLLILFPFFGIKDNYSYAGTELYQIYNKGKDIFYRFMNNPQINWREISYSINKQLLGKITNTTDNKNCNPTCLIIDDTDIHKTGKKNGTYRLNLFSSKPKNVTCF